MRLRAPCAILSRVTSEQLIIGGWVLAQKVPAPAFGGSSLPAQMLTVSDCIQPDLPRPQPWLGDWFQDHREATTARESVRPRPMLVTVAMRPEDARVFIAECDEEPSNWFDLLRRGEPLASDAVVLGFEVVGAETTLDFHSWHCHGYADEVRTVLGIAVNSLGLLQSLGEARQVRDWMLGLPPEQAPEPVPWTVIALAETP